MEQELHLNTIFSTPFVSLSFSMQQSSLSFLLFFFVFFNTNLGLSFVVLPSIHIYSDNPTLIKIFIPQFAPYKLLVAQCPFGFLFFILIDLIKC